MTEDVGTLIARLREATGADALADVAVERQRQIEQEGWTSKHDDRHDGGEMAYAAACYALSSRLPWAASLTEIITRLWPWDAKWWKPQDKRRSLVKAGALIIAEIERRDRKAALEARRQAP